MNIPTPARQKRRSHPDAMTLMWATLLLILALTWIPAIPAGAHTQLTLPTLVPAVIAPAPSDLVVIHGEGFSPGGLVRIATFDQSGNVLLQELWTVASTAGQGSNDMPSSAYGRDPGGEVSELVSRVPVTVYGPNGSQDPAHGYVPADTGGTGDATYGPNGSQDPAQGYVPADSESRETAWACGQDLIVRGYDQRTSTWSNPIDVVVTC